MDLQKKNPNAAKAQDEENTKKIEPAAPAPHGDEEHTHSNYIFALKVLGVLLAIIAIIVILQASGVSIAIKDWLFDAVHNLCAVSSFLS